MLSCLAIKFCLKAISSDIDHSITVDCEKIHISMSNICVLHSHLSYESPPPDIESQPTQVFLEWILLIINFLSYVSSCHHHCKYFSYILSLREKQHRVCCIRLNTERARVEEEFIIPLWFYDSASYLQIAVFLQLVFQK